MRLRESLRVPLLLVTCFVTALLFPRACDGARMKLGTLFPATAALTAAHREDALTAAREEVARLTQENARYEEELLARAEPQGALAGVAYARRRERRPLAIPARVRQRDASWSRRSFLVDAGRDDGVEAGMPVVHGTSLVGLVLASFEHAARVVRIDDPTPESVVHATVLPAAGAGAEGAAPRPHGVARGTGDGGLVVSLLQANDARVGDLVVTGVGNRFVPEGLLLGEVVAFADEDRDGSFEAQVRPLRDLDTLSSVNVLRDEDALAEAARARGRK
jgi:rod shape-determining protein MreC